MLWGWRNKNADVFIFGVLRRLRVLCIGNAKVSVTLALPSIRNFTGRIYSAKARDSETGQTTPVIRQYIDIDGDGHIDGKKR
jgi:hypothetical protein